jgi:N-acetylneuraminate lyase
MNNPHEFAGILPAVVTPIRDGRFWPEAFEGLLDFVYEAGSDGIYVCGQTGEGLLLPAQERMRAVESAIRNSPKGKTVIAHVGAYSATEAIALAKHAAHTGVHAISSLPPMGGHSFAEIRTFYQALASAAGVPLFIYYFPDLCPAIADTPQILELAAIPNVAGLKFTDFNLYKLWNIRDAGNIVYSGRDEVLAAALLMGADGGIGTFYNLTPDWFVDVYRKAKTGDWAGARETQDHINELIRIVLKYPSLAAVKMLLARMGMDCGESLLPRRPLTDTEEQQLLAELEPTHFAATHLAAAKSN